MKSLCRHIYACLCTITMEVFTLTLPWYYILVLTSIGHPSVKGTISYIIGTISIIMAEFLYTNDARWSVQLILIRSRQAAYHIRLIYYHIDHTRQCFVKLQMLINIRYSKGPI